MSWIYYLLEANFYLTVFYLAYILILRNETYYQFNRAYLLLSSLLAFVIPFMQLGFLKPVTEGIATTVIIRDYHPVTADAAPVVAHYTRGLSDYCLGAYLLVAGVLFINLAFKFYKLFRLSRNNKNTETGSYKLVETTGEHDAFSFFNYLFINPQLTFRQTIIRHELVHIQQKHSWDIIYTELIKIINWFNPVIYLVQLSIKEVHEFIADRETVEQEHNTAIYADFLVNNAYGLSGNSLINTFFNKSLIKKRIIMLHQKRSGRLARLKYLVALPVCAALLIVSTLGFSKSYGFIDLAPAPKANNAILQTVKADLEPVNKVTAKGYKYTETGYLVKSKSDFRVIIFEKDGSQKEYFRNAATKATIDMLKAKYGYAFPTMNIYAKLPPPPPVPVVDNRPPPPPPAPPVGKVKKYPPPSIINDHFTPLGTYFSKKVRYPAEAKENKTVGGVVAQFDVSDDHRMTNISIIKGIGHGCDEEVERVLKSFTGTLNNAKSGTYKLAINFNLYIGENLPKVKFVEKDPTFIGEIIVIGYTK